MSDFRDDRPQASASAHGRAYDRVRLSSHERKLIDQLDHEIVCADPTFAAQFTADVPTADRRRRFWPVRRRRR